MTLLRAAVTLLFALLVQAGIGRIWPQAHSWVDVLLVPVALQATGGTQRSAMLTGCISGLLDDTWFQVGPFGLGGFRRTLLGWLISGVAGWIDLNNPAGRLLTGASLALGDGLVDLLLRGLLDQHVRAPGIGAMLTQAAVTGVLTVAVGSLLDRFSGEPTPRRFA